MFAVHQTLVNRAEQSLEHCSLHVYHLPPPVCLSLNTCVHLQADYRAALGAMDHSPHGGAYVLRVSSPTVLDEGHQQHKHLHKHDTCQTVQHTPVHLSTWSSHSRQIAHRESSAA